jgi:hypothetical protein
VNAEISVDGRYRYRLDRALAETGIVVAFFGVNPSRADAEIDDPTSRKWKYFARKLGARKYIAGNPFALRSHDVKELAVAVDPIGWMNEWYLQQIIAEADVLVPCWGSRMKLLPALRPKLDNLASMLSASGKPLKIFGLTASGDPKHPLMLSYETPLIDWRRP